MKNQFVDMPKKEDRDLIDDEYIDCIFGLIRHEKISEMEKYVQHGDVTCLEHSLCVSYRSYQVCKRLGFDYRSAARGGLLHDFFLYDWHGKKQYKGFHGFKHAKVALDNACMYFELNEKEKDIIRKHMWPLNLTLPKHRESYVVMIIDKYCALLETTNIGRRDITDSLRMLITY